VYVFRHAPAKEILKFGATDWLRTRIIGNYLGGYAGATTERIYKELSDNNMIQQVEIAWIVTQDKKEALRMEYEFRRDNIRSHGRRPRWDHRDKPARRALVDRGSQAPQYPEFAIVSAYQDPRPRRI
jgi:hypothetical protein